MGHNIGHINSQFLEHRGVPKVDEIEFFNDWMLRSGNRANPSLVMKFVKNSGSAFDWFTDGFSYDKMDETVVVGFWPSERIHRQLGGYKFWVGTATFQMRYGPGGKTGPTLEDISEDCHKKARALGSETYFGMEAMQLVKKKGRVIGAIAKNSNGNYVYFHASRGVILASGDFSANKEMLDELCVDMADICKKSTDISVLQGPEAMAAAFKWVYGQAAGWKHVRCQQWVETIAPFMRHLKILIFCFLIRKENVTVTKVWEMLFLQDSREIR